MIIDPMNTFIEYLIRKYSDCNCGHTRGDHADGKRCQGVQWIEGGHIEKCGCRAYTNRGAA